MGVDTHLLILPLPARLARTVRRLCPPSRSQRSRLALRTGERPWHIAQGESESASPLRRHPAPAKKSNPPHCQAVTNAAVHSTHTSKFRYGPRAICSFKKRTRTDSRMVSIEFNNVLSLENNNGTPMVATMVSAMVSTMAQQWYLTDGLRCSDGRPVQSQHRCCKSKRP